MNAFTLKTAKIGNSDIAYVDEGEGIPVLLVHGLAGDHTAWNAQIDAWRERYRVIAPDSRGAGKSSQVDEPITLQEMADDFLGLMDLLGLQQFHYVGRSMGGCIGQLAALTAPERVLSLAMLASCAKFDRLALRCLVNMREVLEWTGSWDVHARHSVQNFVSPTFINTRPDEVRQIEAIIGGTDRLPGCYIQQNHAVGRHDTLARLHEITCPTLVLSGGKDPLGGPLLTSWMIERLPNCTWHEFPEASHFFFLEEPARFMALMNDWLAQQAGARAAA